MQPTPCAPCCTTPQSVNIPGSPGIQGLQGIQGIQGEQGDPGADGTTLVAPVFSYGLSAPPLALSDAAFTAILASTLVIPTAGTYILWARLKTDLNAVTYAGFGETITAKIRRIVGAVGDIIGPATTPPGPVITLPKATSAITQTNPLLLFPVISFVFAAGDEVQMYAQLSADPGAGSVDANEAEIVALKIV